MEGAKLEGHSYISVLLLNFKANLRIPYLLVACNSVTVIKFAADMLSQPLQGVDFKIKHLSVGGKRLKLTIWDTGIQWILNFLIFHFNVTGLTKFCVAFGRSWTGEVWNSNKLLLQRCARNHSRYVIYRRNFILHRMSNHIF